MMKKIVFIDMDGVLVDFGKQVEKARENSNISDRLANGAKNFKGKLLRFGYDYEKKI